ncbi:hypothetical protein PIB30_018926 [Stylosanthes scabra]|uniref:Uncharacterized protein n=1 Tax=Stylosanthes scabra TaxID=79078 RepID=A0ABU6X622_9FABA|nr:hypothetical protein [Stylosanthes scabra]
MRQFGLDQPIPDRSHQPDHLHSITRSGRTDDVWHVIHADDIQRWDERRDRIPEERPLATPLTSSSQYMKWYRDFTTHMDYFTITFLARGAFTASAFYHVARCHKPPSGEWCLPCQRLLRGNAFRFRASAWNSDADDLGYDSEPERTLLRRRREARRREREAALEQQLNMAAEHNDDNFNNA